MHFYFLSVIYAKEDKKSSFIFFALHSNTVKSELIEEFSQQDKVLT